MSISYEQSDGINFFTFIYGERLNINESDLKLGFYGEGGRDYHVEIGSWQNNVYLVDVNEQGIVQLPWNTSFFNDGSGYLNDLVDPIDLSNIPNYQSTINVRFVSSSSVKIMSAQVKLYDGSDLDNTPIAVRAKIAEIYHPGRVQVVNQRHTRKWQNAGSGEYISLWKNPGEDSVYAGRYTYKRSNVNDWFLCLSASPKEEAEVTRNFGSMYCVIEYL